jgi:hypothetical protein
MQSDLLKTVIRKRRATTMIRHYFQQLGIVLPAARFRSGLHSLGVTIIFDTQILS